MKLEIAAEKPGKMQSFFRISVGAGSKSGGRRRFYEMSKLTFVECLPKTKRFCKISTLFKVNST